MSGGVPKRIQISRTQQNTYCKAGGKDKAQGLVLCSGRRSQKAMCNYVMRRTNVPPQSHIAFPDNITGGEISFFREYKVHTFKTVGSGTFTIPNFNNTLSGLTIEYLIIGGGGGGGTTASNVGGTDASTAGGGGGAIIIGSVAVTNGSAYSITVGGGGASQPIPAARGDQGGVSVVLGLSLPASGGLGGLNTFDTNSNGVQSGSLQPGGTIGDPGSVWFSPGSGGGCPLPNPGAGQNQTTNGAGDGGSGSSGIIDPSVYENNWRTLVASLISVPSYTSGQICGGGAGGAAFTSGAAVGKDGGGDGGFTNSTGTTGISGLGQPAQINSGGGGGGGATTAPAAGPPPFIEAAGGQGGSGLVILRYKGIEMPGPKRATCLDGLIK